MATYEKFIYDIPPYQEGNEADFEFELDANFPISQVQDITFQVRDIKMNELISLKRSTTGIALTGRVVSIKLLPADTTGRTGTHVYEIDFINANGNPFATIGGSFTINRQINTL